MTRMDRPTFRQTQEAEERRVKEIIARDKRERDADLFRRSVMDGSAEAERVKRRNETDLEWRQRVARLDDFASAEGGSILTDEMENRGEHTEAFVMHIETGTLSKTKLRKSQSGMIRMYNNGQIDADQFSAAIEIAHVAERIEMTVGFRTSNLSFRVDHSGSAKNVLIEHIGQVRSEMSYSLWRSRLPVPRRMIIDLITSDRAMAATARVFKTSWPIARSKMIDALDMWIRIRNEMDKSVTVDDLLAAQRRVIDKGE